MYVYHIYYIFTGNSNWKKQHLETHRPANIEKQHQIASCPTSVQRSTFMASEFHALVFFATPTRHHWCQSPPIHLQLDRFNVCFPGSAGTDWS